MIEQVPTPSRRTMIASSAVIGLGLAVGAGSGPVQAAGGGGSDLIRPFRVSFPTRC